MNKTEQAQQLRLAADIFENGHPFEVRHGTSEKWHPSRVTHPARAVLEGWHLRPILATPPDNRPLHNPDNLTAEQVGLGYRLGLQEESANQPHEFWGVDGKWRKATEGVGAFMNYVRTYRVPLSVPWPEAKPDPYAELKAAHAAGKTIEVQMPNGEWFDYNPADPQWNLQPECYRIKPEPPAFQLPPPPPGIRWHREDGWKEGDLPQGYRPLVDGEELQPGDEGDYGDGFMRFSGGNRVMYPQYLYRTTRPLVFMHEGKEWTYHRSGDPMPCDGHAEVHVLYADHSQDSHSYGAMSAHIFDWGMFFETAARVIGWRYAETTKTVELGPKDVLPGSVLRGAGEVESQGWCVITSCSETGIRIWRHSESSGHEITWQRLRESDSQINRSIPLTGKWDANAWEPCHKTLANG